MSNASTSSIQTMAAAKYISWEGFQQEYLVKEDGFKYEWLNGEVEKTPYSMNGAQLYIVMNLLAHFSILKAKNMVAGVLMPEADLFFDGHHRRPDICWLTKSQILALAENRKEVPAFVIEIISGNDVMNKVVRKVNDYRAANVQVVWHILPEHGEVHIYSGEKLEHMQVCKEEDICSAAPVMPTYALSVNDIFAKEDEA